MPPLHVVTAIANPIRWESRIRLFHRFAEHMLDSGAKLTVVECAYGARPFELAEVPHVAHVPVRAKTLLWNKENLLNIGFARLPDDWQCAAWIDADITFRRADWVSETVHALQQYDVVQPWSDCYDLGPKDEHLQIHRSFCRLVHEGKPILPSGAGGYTFAHPGYAWAASRRALTRLGGLIETAALGAGDHHMALALIGRVDESIPAGMQPGYALPLQAWQARAMRHIAGNIGYVPGTIEHGWHGSKLKRAYVDRWTVLVRNAFDPQVDLVRNTWGVLELAGEKPRLRHEIDLYFRSRCEDANVVV
jgi:hypothetical protein